MLDATRLGLHLRSTRERCCLSQEAVAQAKKMAPTHSFGISPKKWGKLHNMGQDGDAP